MMKAMQAALLVALLATTALAVKGTGAQLNDDVTPTTGIRDANKNIGYWMGPNTLVGIVFTLLFFWVCQCVLSSLAAVQTPRIMLEKCIDWGKVEKVEE